MGALEASISATCPASFSGVTGGLFLNAIAAAITTHCLIVDNQQWPQDNSNELAHSEESFDFVVVGAGTAGSIVASAITNMNPSWSVLLVEAGDDPGVDSEVPAFLFLNQNSKSDWNYKTQPDGRSCLGFQNKSCIWSKGKCMGGSSSINAMLYIRGHPNDYDKWKQAGKQDWGYEDLKKYFEKLEHLFNINDSEFPGYDFKWYDVLDRAWNELGYRSYNYQGHAALIGTRKVRILTNNGQRVNTAKVYLQRAKNIKVIKNTLVDRVNVNPSSHQVDGIELRNKNKTFNINVKKEVILSAGSIGTPMILMRSGIGPAPHLESLGIDCIHDLPVGKNLQDHIIFPIFVKTNVGNLMNPDIFNLLLMQYIFTRSGPFSTIGITDFMGFLNTNRTSNEPDVQFHYTYFPKNDSLVLRAYLEGLGYENQIISAIEAVNQKFDLLGLYPTLIHPQSIGDILLEKENLFSPIIRANYLSHPSDLSALKRSIDFIQQQEKTKSFKELDIEILDVEIPGCLNLEFNSEEYWECYIRHMATTLYHPVGTAKMGAEDDNTAVVNRHLLVHGIANLRVVDASIMPFVPGANTMAATLAIAEKSVDIIKQKYLDIKDEL